MWLWWSDDPVRCSVIMEYAESSVLNLWYTEWQKLKLLGIQDVIFSKECT